MSQLDPILFSQSQPMYRHTRRRWVPKGVMLLIILVIVGLVNAHSDAKVQATAPIIQGANVISEVSLSRLCYPIQPAAIELSDTVISTRIDTSEAFYTQKLATKNQF